MYADNLVMVYPSVKGLQRLVNICQDYGQATDITFTCKKIAGMHILHKQFKFKNRHTLSLFLCSYQDGAVPCLCLILLVILMSCGTNFFSFRKRIL